MKWKLLTETDHRGLVTRYQYAPMAISSVSPNHQVSHNIINTMRKTISSHSYLPTVRHASQIRRGRECDRGLHQLFSWIIRRFWRKHRSCGAGTGIRTRFQYNAFGDLIGTQQGASHLRNRNTTPMAIALEPRLNGKAPRSQPTPSDSLDLYTTANDIVGQASIRFGHFATLRSFESTNRCHR